MSDTSPATTRSNIFRIIPGTVLGFGISGFLLWLLIRQSHLEWQQIPKAINDPISFLYFFMAMSLFVLVVYIQSLRTCIIFKDQHTSIRDITAYPSLVIGNFYNCVLPGNLGEGIRALHFGRANRIPLPSTLAVFVVEKILDAFFMIPIIAGLVLCSFPNHYLVLSLSILILAVISCCLFLLMAIRYKKLNRVLFALIPGKGVRQFIFKIFTHFEFHCSRMWTQKTIFMYALIGYIMFVLNMLQYFLIMKAVKIDPPVLSITSAVFLSLSMSLIAFLPSAPGNIGVAHYGIFVTLMLMAEIHGVPVNDSMKNHFAIAGICLHFSYFMPEILIGLFFVIRERNILFRFPV